MPSRVVLAVFSGLAVAVACGGRVGSTAENGGGSGGAFGGTGGTVLTGGTGGFGATGGTPVTGGTGGKDAGKDTGPGGTGGYIDPGCPDAEPPPPINDCDPFDQPSTCAPGEACYPFVQYPSQPCEQELYGAICAPAGTGTQGDPCGVQWCAGGYVCVITGQGTECVKLCNLFTENSCPPGLFCVPIDVEGIGGCY